MSETPFVFFHFFKMIYIRLESLEVSMRDIGCLASLCVLLSLPYWTTFALDQCSLLYYVKASKEPKQPFAICQFPYEILALFCDLCLIWQASEIARNTLYLLAEPLATGSFRLLISTNKLGAQHVCSFGILGYIHKYLVVVWVFINNELCVTTQIEKN